MSIGWRVRRRAESRDVGAAAVEMALVLPLLLLLVFGIIDFGRALNTQITLTQGAREGARAVALGQASDDLDARIDEATASINTPVTPTVAECPIPYESGSQAEVQLTTTFEFVTPFGAIAGMFGGGPGGNLVLTGRGVMQCEPIDAAGS